MGLGFRGYVLHFEVPQSVRTLTWRVGGLSNWLF